MCRTQLKIGLIPDPTFVCTIDALDFMKKIIKKLGYVSGYTWPNFLMIFYLKDRVAIVHTKAGFGIIPKFIFN